MEVAIEFAYTGFLCLEKVDNMLDFIRDADFLKIDDIKEEAIKIFLSHLNPLNAVEAYFLSSTYSSVLLKEESKKIILENFENVSKTNEFLKIEFDSLKEILTNNPKIECTEKIFEGVIRWIVQSLETRRKYLMDICGIIQFGNADINMVVRIATQYM